MRTPSLGNGELSGARAERTSGPKHDSRERRPSELRVANFARVALLVEDDESSRDAMVRLTEGEGFEVAVASNLEEARVQLRRQIPQVVLCDLVLPDGDGLSLISEIDTTKTDFIVITGKSAVSSVVSALRQGAHDYLTKPVDTDRLCQLLKDVATARGCADSRAASLEETVRTGRFGRMIGRSQPMMSLYHQILRVAPTEATVLLQGETGTGKELVAMTVHELSSRRVEPFIAMNCGAVSQTLIESELFGHERGAFTGADRRHLGVFERAKDGTLFLDEITEMPMDLQVKLLRVLETRSFHRVGGETTIKTNARMIAATNRSPDEAMRMGKLREDLFYRLRVFPLQLPPLQARKGDAILLAQEFVQYHNGVAGTKKRLGDDALAWIAEQSWPGNVRELKNVIERAFILADDVIDAECIRIDPEPSRTSAPDSGVLEHEGAQSAGVTESGELEIRIPVGSTIAVAEKALILATLKHCAGDKNECARMLGISVKTLYTRLSVYNATQSA